MTLNSGVKLGPYEILSPLGAGGMGEVYRARDSRLGRDVAIKVLPAHLSSDLLRKQRFEREARTISSLNHPHICVLHDIGHQDGMNYLVMECVEGVTLEKRLEEGPLPVEQVVKIGAEVADALGRAHRSGVVHRDLKPGNIMLTSTGTKLLDFGLAKPAAALAAAATLTASAKGSAVTEQGTIVGTFQYMSPEQVEGKELDGRSDIFSLGAVLYEMLTGQRAFPGKSQLTVASSILEKEPVSIVSVKPLTPSSFERAIRRCLAKDPEDRWQTARDLAIELKWIADAGSSAGAAAPPRKARVTSREGILAIALVLALGAATILGLLHKERPAADAHATRTYIKPQGTSGFIFSGDQKGFALSPDGRNIAYVAATPTSKVGSLDPSFGFTGSSNTPGNGAAAFPFWSTDN